MLVFHTKSLVFAHNGRGGFYVRGGSMFRGGVSMFRGGFYDVTPPQEKITLGVIKLTRTVRISLP